MKTCLAFDTSGRFCSVAILKEGDLFSEQCDPGINGHATYLVPIIQKVLQQANLRAQDIDVIAVPVGPGSFTGIRIAVATAQGLILSTKAKAFAPTCLEVYAYAALQTKMNSQKILVFLDNKRGGFYGQVFDHTMHPLSDPAMMSFKEVEALIQKDSSLFFVSDTNIPTLDKNREVILSVSIAEATLKYWQFKGVATVSLIRPFYLHNPEFSKYHG